MSVRAVHAGVLPSPRGVRLMVVEHGAARFLRRSQDESEDTVAITQTADEPPTLLAQRLMARLAGFERGSARCRSAVLLCSLDEDSATLAARRLIALGLATHARVHPALGEIVLQAPASVSPRGRAELFQLADELTSVARRNSFMVRVRFSDEAASQTPIAPKSGIFSRVS